MIGNIIRKGAPGGNEKGDSSKQTSKGRRGIQQAQEVIYSSLLEIVKHWPPEDVLLEFKNLFIYHANSFSSEVFSAVYEIIFSNNQKEFINTLKRCCYILINNWAITRKQEYITQLIQLFSDPALKQRTQSPTLKRLRIWIAVFLDSHDFQELKLFAARYEVDQSQIPGQWKQRYTSFLLAPQYADLDNPIEQREAARVLSKQLRERFKFDLAMYVTRSQSRLSQPKVVSDPEGGPSHPAQANTPVNPTALGDEALRLIKLILVRRGQFSYTNVAHIFVKQINGMRFSEFKASLLQYLTFAVEDQQFVETIHRGLAEKLSVLYTHHQTETITDALLLRTCNRVIEYVTTEEQGEPSPLFISLVSAGNPLPLVVLLLKIILISRNSRLYLEARIAKLIEYYGNLPENDCKWVIHFLEVLNVTFAIYAENVEYNLIKMADAHQGNSEPSANQAPGEMQQQCPTDFLDQVNNYRIFSLQRQARAAKPDPEAFSLDEQDDINPDLDLSEIL
ncbi:hypothetical protein BST81_12715 [Leptolyngbya sp. 'hensonii']|uniref:hypothetical protein n=1 Tax=Leptolyngbya sp. 'hensonii' TaxID=1922337 RepID=UPI0009500405|nr:hypothetical protein [Leptolyngbya sp. 'hensonii']OLP17914.1 hypothetical protein BST81_12715 [Leptolyngbya sp. 'hensonii']